MPTADWRMEKAGNIIKVACDVIQQAKVNGAPVDEVASFCSAILWDATKLYCDGVDEVYERKSTWSPDLPRFLTEHPEECDDTLQVIASEDYRDNYYDGQS